MKRYISKRIYALLSRPLFVRRQQSTRGLERDFATFLVIWTVSTVGNHLLKRPRPIGQLSDVQGIVRFLATHQPQSLSCVGRSRANGVIVRVVECPTYVLQLANVRKSREVHGRDVVSIRVRKRRGDSSSSDRSLACWYPTLHATGKTHDQVRLQNNAPAPWTSLTGNTFKKKLGAEAAKRFRRLIHYGQKR